MARRAEGIQASDAARRLDVTRPGPRSEADTGPGDVMTLPAVWEVSSRSTSWRVGPVRDRHESLADHAAIRAKLTRTVAEQRGAARRGSPKSFCGANRRRGKAPRIGCGPSSQHPGVPLAAFASSALPARWRDRGRQSAERGPRTPARAILPPRDRLGHERAAARGSRTAPLTINDLRSKALRRRRRPHA
jgi:hypothetical protein